MTEIKPGNACSQLKDKDTYLGAGFFKPNHALLKLSPAESVLC
jgi:hypothetical protein